jgi:hypothetical protein
MLFLMSICALALWLFAYLGIRNYAYDHSESMTGAKILIHSILILYFIALTIKIII